MKPGPVAAATPDAPRPPRRWRRPALGAVGLLAAALVAVLSLPWWLNARRAADLALVQLEASTGLDWSYGDEPAIRWRPQPWLSLPRLEGRDANGRTVLAAARIEIAVPWATLRGESLRVDALHLDAPALDLEAASDWWDARPAGDAAHLPWIDGLRITRGRVMWSRGALQDLELSLPRFAIDEPIALSLGGRMVGTTAGDASSFPLSIRLLATPREAPLRLEGFELWVDGTGPIAPAVARGRLQLAPWVLEANGELASWPEAWPALPAPLSASRSPIVFTLTQHGGTPTTAATQLALSRDSHRVETDGTPDSVMAWLADRDAAALPPLRIRAEIPSLDLDGVRLEGVTVALDGGDDEDRAKQGSR
ncbi:hypothetical protein GCM10028794_13020 [Silanimonas algicola]